jgi:hypothetical protein
MIASLSNGAPLETVIDQKNVVLPNTKMPDNWILDDSYALLKKAIFKAVTTPNWLWTN